MRLRAMAAGVALIAAMAVPAAAQTPGPLRLDPFMKSSANAAWGNPTALGWSDSTPDAAPLSQSEPSHSSWPSG
jgi:hypothetical protein